MTDFQWYVSVLIDLAYVACGEQKHPDVGKEIAAQLIDVCVRVHEVRGYAVDLGIRLLSDEGFVDGANANNDGREEVLGAVAWVIGEYTSELPEKQKQSVIPSLLSSRSLSSSATTASICVQAAAKVFGRWAVELAERWNDDSYDDIQKGNELDQTVQVVADVNEKLLGLASSNNIEVQERVRLSCLCFLCSQTSHLLGCEYTATLQFHPCRPNVLQIQIRCTPSNT